MTTLLKHPARIGSLLLCSALACSGAQAQNTARPELGGVWSNASLTNLTRRGGLESLVVTAQEALVIAAGAHSMPRRRIFACGPETSIPTG